MAAHRLRRLPTYVTTPLVLNGLPEGVVVQNQDTQEFYRADGEGNFTRHLAEPETVTARELWGRLRVPLRVTHIPDRYLPKSRHYRRRTFPKGD